jgi:hypothetical protein
MDVRAVVAAFVAAFVTMVVTTAAEPTATAARDNHVALDPWVAAVVDAAFITPAAFGDAPC